MGPKFSIITPSFRQLDWLKLCAASIADQQGVEVEHIVQDAGTEGIADCGLRIAESAGAECCTPVTGEALRAAKPGYTLRVVSEKDNGMYDAVNRGLRRASGEILAYLNCDEQYLPGALAGVADFFEAHPNVDVVFGNVVVVNESGQYLCSREVLLPKLYHAWVCTLGVFTAATFFRRNVIDRHGVFFPDDWRVIGDALWVIELLRKKMPMAVLGGFTTAFTETGANLGTHSSAKSELKRLQSSAPAWVLRMRLFWIAQHRLRRLLNGLYWPASMEYSIFSRTSPARRQAFVVDKPTAIWRQRL